MNIPAKVREDIDDPLARELVIDVCLLSMMGLGEFDDFF
jgi:hypothetical protein